MRRNAEHPGHVPANFRPDRHAGLVTEQQGPRLSGVAAISRQMPGRGPGDDAIAALATRAMDPLAFDVLRPRLGPLTLLATEAPVGEFQLRPRVLERVVGRLGNGRDLHPAFEHFGINAGDHGHEPPLVAVLFLVGI
jgi:hypothetical protein